MNQQLESTSDATSPVILTALVDFLRWASTYGHEIRPSTRLVAQGIVKDDSFVSLEWSEVLSASINFGYEPQNQTVFMALDPEEFEWLPNLPIAEVVVGRDEVYILIDAVVVEGEPIDAMAFAVKTGQPKLWRAFPHATNVGFVRVRHGGTSHELMEVASGRYALRYLND